MILVVYLFPALLKQNQRSGEAFARHCAGVEAGVSKDKSALASYEEIAEGFRQRFAILTAVCQSLNKGDNCGTCAVTWLP